MGKLNYAFSQEMKKQNDNSRRKTSEMISGALAMAVLLSFALAPSLHAQSADISTPSPDAPASEGSKPAEEEAVLKPVDGTPSRFAGRDIASYTASRAAIFSMRDRATDPFGLNQDPDVKPVVKNDSTGSPANRRTALPPTPLSDIVKLIRVTTIMPAEKKFLVGMRSFSESDEFSLIFQGRKIKMKVIEVSAMNILFRNIESGETASLQIEMLPPGMVPGSGKLQPPGMVSPLDDIPLELGSETRP